MPTYAIGDIHGCYKQLLNLLDLINYNPQQDTLWFTGDLVNGGPNPADTVRFIKNLPSSTVCVLGNHDLALLAVAAGKIKDLRDRKIGLTQILNAEDRDELFAWLRQRPLTHYSAEFKTLLVHAGVLPIWDLAKVQELAREVEVILRGSNPESLYENFLGEEPEVWSDSLTGWDRIRFIVNCLMRMRFCSTDGALDLVTKGEVSAGAANYFPWFKIPNPSFNDTRIIFGHWAAILGETGVANIEALDTGCVWGNKLTALRLDDMQRFSVPGI